MKYYIYVSDAKIDMLFPQVPHDIKKRVAVEWRIDVKVLGASRRSESESEDNRIARLNSVVSFLRSRSDLGTVDAPAEYIEGKLPMKWGPYELLLPDFGAPDPSAQRVRQVTDFVLFGGLTDRTLF